MKKTLLIIGLIAVFVAAFIWSLPAPIDDDLNQIGNGKKLVSRTGYPATDKIMQNYKAESAELLFFDESGELFKRKFALVNAADLTIILASVD
jgi:hypothetical protein